MDFWIILMIAVPVLFIFLIIRGIGSLFGGGKSTQGVSPELFGRLVYLLEQKGIITQDELYGKVSGVMREPAAPQATSAAQAFVAAPVPLESVAPVVSVPAAQVTSQGEFTGSGKWLTLVGIIAILLGVGFFLSYAFQSGLIGQTGRVALGILAGIGFLVAGDLFYRKHSAYAAFITGGGIGLLYLSIFASFSFYQFISQPVAFLFMTVVTVVSVLLSVRYNLVWIAGAGVIGGFLTPVLLSTGRSNDFVLWNYILLLDLGVLVVAYFKRWTGLLWGALLGTLFIVSPTALGGVYAQSGFWFPVTYLVIFWAVFTAAILVFYYFHNEKPESAEFLFMLINGVIFAGEIYQLLDPHYHAMIGFLPFLMAVAYTGVALAGAVFRNEDRRLILSPAGLAIFFLTLVFPMSFEGMWITASWFVEAAIIAWVGAGAGTNLVVFSVPVAAIALGRLLFIDNALASTPAFFVVNERTFLFLIATMALFFLGKMLLRVAAVAGQFELKSFGNFSLIAANGLAIAWAWGEIGGLVAQRIFSSEGGSFAFSVFLAGYAFALLMIGIATRSAAVRQGSVALFGVVIFKTFLIDVWALSGFFRISAFISLGVILLTVGYLYSRYADRIKGFLQGN